MTCVGDEKEKTTNDISCLTAVQFIELLNVIRNLFTSKRCTHTHRSMGRETEEEENNNNKYRTFRWY